MIRPNGFLAVFLFIAFAAAADAQQTATPAQSPVVGVRELLDVPYVTNGHERQKLDLYLPTAFDESPRPVIVRIHGGAWRHGDKTTQRSVGNYVKQGYIGVAINYRFSQHAIFPAQIEDCKAAIRWLKAHAKEYGIDPARIGVMGSSAGGHLAALLGATGDTKEFDIGENFGFSSSVCAVVDNYGPTDFLQIVDNPFVASRKSAVSQLLGGPISENAELAARANPIKYLSANDPPFLIMHGDADPLVPPSQSEALHEALAEAGVTCEYHVVKGGLHGGEAFRTSRVKAIVSGFLEYNIKRLRPQTASVKSSR